MKEEKGICGTIPVQGIKEEKLFHFNARCNTGGKLYIYITVPGVMDVEVWGIIKMPDVTTA